jgi:hypothetical protein
MELNAAMSRDAKSFGRDWYQLLRAICWTVFALGLLVQGFSPQLKSGIKPTSFKPTGATEIAGERHLYAVTSRAAAHDPPRAPVRGTVW